MCPHYPGWCFPSILDISPNLEIHFFEILKFQNFTLAIDSSNFWSFILSCSLSLALQHSSYTESAWCCWKIHWGSAHFFRKPSTVFFRLDNFYWPVFKGTNSLLLSPSAVKPIQSVFYIRYFNTILEFSFGYFFLLSISAEISCIFAH